ncbi:hypothetical protein BD830_103632 [Maritimibacter alkaliphilus HTCC2654]|nr:hypothetical protein BD830_103632 [Maritimibacter alkaliphilus HTCC2654]
MAIRIFKCTACGHRMRLASNYCGSCFNEKPGWQKPGSLIAMAAIPAIVVVGFFAFIMLAVPTG